MFKKHFKKIREENITYHISDDEHYNEDNRISIKVIYSKLNQIAKNGLWNIETIYNFDGFESYVLYSKITGPAIYLIADIHGEEPAPPNAIYKKLNYINFLVEQNIPIVLYPLCNPIGYINNWRYPNIDKYDEKNVGNSVGDSEYLLKKNMKTTSVYSEALTNIVLKLSKQYVPLISIDFHEDDMIDKGYIYSQGINGSNDIIAKKIVDKMVELKYPIMLSGKTRFNEPIINGMVSNSNDGSIDNLIASKQIFINNEIEKGPNGKHVIVVETSSKNKPIEERINIHSSIIDMLEHLYFLAIKNK